MNTIHRIPFKTKVVGSILLAAALIAVILLLAGNTLGVLPRPVFASLAAPTSGQIAAVEGGNLLFAEPPGDRLFLPAIQR